MQKSIPPSPVFAQRNSTTPDFVRGKKVINLDDSPSSTVAVSPRHLNVDCDSFNELEVLPPHVQPPLNSPPFPFVQPPQNSPENLLHSDDMPIPQVEPPLNPDVPLSADDQDSSTDFWNDWNHESYSPYPRLEDFSLLNVNFDHPHFPPGGDDDQNSLAAPKRRSRRSAVAKIRPVPSMVARGTSSAATRGVSVAFRDILQRHDSAAASQESLPVSASVPAPSNMESPSSSSAAVPKAAAGGPPPVQKKQRKTRSDKGKRRKL